MAQMDLVNRLERLGFPCETALRLVSVLLWLQRAVEMPNLLSEIVSMENGMFSTIVSEVREILGFLSSPSRPNPGTLSRSNLQSLVANRNGSLSIMGLFREKERVRAIVDKNFNLLSKAKGKVKKGTDDSESSRRSVSTQSPDHVARQQSLNVGNAGQGYNQTLTGQSSSSFDATGLSHQSNLNHAAPLFVPVSSVNRGLEEERCLYLTFSKGYPLNGQEIATFFRDLCNNAAGERQNSHAVETVYVHRGEDDDVALFGKVVFCNPYLPKFFLGGQKEVKYIVNGKELWCKRFLPKSIRNNLIEPRGENSEVRGPHGEVHFRGASGFGASSSGGQIQGIGRSLQVVEFPFIDMFPYQRAEPVATSWPVGQFQVPVGIMGAGAQVGPSQGGVAPVGVMIYPRQQVGYYQVPAAIRGGSPFGSHHGGGEPGSVMVGPSPSGYYQVPIGIRVAEAQGVPPQGVGAPRGVLVGPIQMGYYQVPTHIIRSGGQGAILQGGGQPRGVMAGHPCQGAVYHQVLIGNSGTQLHVGGALPGGVMIGPGHEGYYQLMGRGVLRGSYSGGCPGPSPGNMEGTFLAAGRGGLTGSNARIHGHGPIVRDQHQ